jgi:hypothetical protein
MAIAPTATISITKKILACFGKYEGRIFAGYFITALPPAIKPRTDGQVFLHTEVLFARVYGKK